MRTLVPTRRYKPGTRASSVAKYQLSNGLQHFSFACKSPRCSRSDLITIDIEVEWAILTTVKYDDYHPLFRPEIWLHGETRAGSGSSLARRSPVVMDERSRVPTALSRCLFTFISIVSRQTRPVGDEKKNNQGTKKFPEIGASQSNKSLVTITVMTRKNHLLLNEKTMLKENTTARQNATWISCSFREIPQCRTGDHRCEFWLVFRELQ